MNNMFVTETNTAVDSVNYDACKSVILNLTTQNAFMSNMDEYEKFVHTWKNYHEKLVEAIQYFKREKNRLRDSGQFNACYRAWNNAVSLGDIATEFYKIRGNGKERLFNNEFPDFNVKVAS